MSILLKVFLYWVYYVLYDKYLFNNISILYVLQYTSWISNVSNR